MHLETQVALNFLISFLYNKLPRRRVNQFGEELEKALKTKFEGHWYPDKPHKGSAYRCIRCTPPLDPFVFEVAARNSGVSLIDIQENLPQELSIWVDPGEVSYRISEKGPVKILYGEKSDLTSSQCKDIGLNPDARCFKPIEAWPHGQFSNVVENNLTSAAPLNPFVAVKKNNPVTFTTAAFAATKFGSTKLKTQQAKAKSHRSSPTDSNINFIRQKVIPSMTKDNFYNGINKMRGMTELDCEVFHVSAKINANVNNKLSDSMPDWRVMPNSLETSHKAWAFSQVDQTMELSPTTIDNYSPLNQVKHQLAHLCNNKDFCNSNLADPWMETGENTSELETTPFMTDKLWDEILNWNCDKSFDEPNLTKMNEDTISEPNLSPQSVVDSASIANCMNMNKNKESLKLKLMLRRPIDVLVDQGILPPPKSSPLFYEQKLKLERAKTGDFLKHKIQRRPQRDELIQQHILEETFDPSYYEQERKLKKARLADDLNERLSQRPGPLELIKGNILHTDEYLEQAIKEGQITFKKTCEGEIIKNPPKRFVFEEESSSDSAPSPLQLGGKPLLMPSGNTFLSVAPSQAEPCSSVSSVLNSPLSYLVTTPVTSLLSSNTTTVLITTQPPTNTCLATSNLTTQVVNSNLVSKTIESVHIGPFKSQLTKSKKKIKSKNQPKARVIKFHEYTGPPNAKKQSNASQQDNETSYELLLKQQQLFLQWQLECQQKYPQLAKQNNIPDMTEIGTKPQIIESNASKMVNTSEILNNSNNNQCNNANACVKQIKQDEAKVQLIKSGNQKQVNVDMTLTNNLVNNAKQYAPIVKKLISKLEDMKVSDLKAELKKRNLPVSGAKQQLIERLKPFSDSVVSDTNNAISAEMKGNLMLSINNTCQNESHFSAQQELMNGIGNSLPGGTAFILNSANNNTNSGEAKQNKSLKLNEDLVLVTNNGDKFSSVPIQLSQQQNSVESQTLNIATIPITNNFIPQYQIVSSTPTDKVNLNGINLTNHQIQSPIANNILVNNNVINSSNNLQSNLTFNNPTAAIFSNKPSSNVTILTSPQLQLAQIKNGLSLNLTQPLVPNLTTNKLMSMPNSTPVFHQLLLYPSAINANQEITNVIANPKPQRSNSIPNESFHQLQRNTSLPLIINQVPVQPNVKIIRIDESETTENDNKVKTGNSVNIEQNQKYEQSVDDLNFNHTNLVSKTPLEAKVLFSKSEPIQGQHKLFGNTTTSDEKAEHSVNAKGGEMNCLEASQCLATSLKPSRIDKTSQCSDDLHVSSISDNSNNQIQPDSTTNSNTLDFDFMLNFDDLNDDFIDSNHLNNCNIDQLTEGNNMNKNGESNDMIDFGDNWFEMTFGDAQNDIKPSQMMNDTGRNVLSYEKDSNGDNSMMDTINRLFDEHPVANNGKSSNQYQVDYSRNDPNLCNNMLGRGPHSSQNNYELPSNTMDCHMNSNQNNANFNSINNRVNHYLNDNMVQSDSFADYSFFEDNDFKNSMDFAIY